MMTATSTAPVHVRDVLVVDDNAADTTLLQAVFRQLHMTHRVHFVADGLEAMAFLHKEGKFAHAPRPAVILLDLNLPKLHGRDVLQQLKQHSELRTIPVMIFSSSAAESDIVDCYALGASAYLVKPFQLDEMVQLMRTVVEFWLSFVRLPPSTP
jgi:CheY-like chemotaxis protein